MQESYCPNQSYTSTSSLVIKPVEAPLTAGKLSKCHSITRLLGMRRAPMANGG
jgi:hypothetical protein